MADDGPGVPADERERIFDGFVTVNGSAGQGTGLALAISRAMAHQHGGEITCDYVDAGARFTLQLPAAESTERTCSPPSPHPSDAAGDWNLRSWSAQWADTTPGPAPNARLEWRTRGPGSGA